MKKLLFAFCMLISALCTTYAEDADVHRFGNYNVRYVAKNGDTGGKLWTSRKDRVLKLLTDYDYDIVSLNEVTGSNKDETGATVNQKQDIETYMSNHGYNTIAYERENRQYSWNMICYKKDKYTCIEHSSFWISPTPFSVSFGWDCGTENNIYRRVIVAHMKVKATGEEFYFFGTHVNYGAYSSGIDGARVVSRLCKQYAGNLPMILAGDINMNREGHTDAYRGWMYCFREAKLTAQENICLPTTNPTVTFTTNNWCRPGTNGCSGSEFDHIFYCKMECLQNIIITETYDQDQTPSDHFAVMARVRLMKNHKTSYYASDETTLKAAIAKAEPLDTIYLKNGEFALTESISPDRSLCFIGGYNSLKKSVTGTTELVTADKTKPAFNLPKWYSLEVQNCIFNGYNTSSIAGGGAVLCNGSELKLRNCTFTDNSSTGSGGAVQAGADAVNIEGCTFTSNTSATNGGAVSAPARSLVRMMDTHLLNNTSPSGSALALMSAEYANIQRCSFIGNTSTKHGTLYCASYSNTKSINLLNCSFLNNVLTAGGGLATVTKLYGGSAVNVNMQDKTQCFNMGLCSLIGNKTTGKSSSNFYGTALNIFKGRACLMDNLMVGNSTSLGDAAPAWNDSYIDGTNVDLWRDTKNVYSKDLTNLNGTIVNTLGGQCKNGEYTVYITSKQTYQLKQATLCGVLLANLPLQQRMCETAFSYDLDEDGTTTSTSYVTTDQLGVTRAKLTACIGAVEYTGDVEAEVTALHDIDINEKTNAKFIRDGQLYILKNNHIYNALGFQIQ